MLRQTQEAILVVEDSPVDLLMLKRCLEHYGYRVLSAGNGHDALHALDLCPKQDVHVVAVISDICMPGMDGMQLLQEVRKKPHTRKVPFLFLTGVDANLMWDAEKYGANGYLLKPVVPDMLMRKLRELLPEKDLVPQAAA